MASKRASIPAKRLFDALKPRSSLLQARQLSTQQPSPEATLSETYLDTHLDAAPTEPVLQDEPLSAIQPLQQPPQEPRRPITNYKNPTGNPFLTTTTATLHAFPSLEPTRFAIYPSTHLLVPIRKDILHRAVIYEGDSARQGTANTKYRTEVHGSNKKVRPQKGTGSARLGDKKSPMLRGGGVAFGPKPRDFSTELPAKIYDLAWRTALSYRYRMGQLLLLDGEADLQHIGLHSRARYLRDMLTHNNLGNSDGRTLFVTVSSREALEDALHNQAERMGREGKVRTLEDVDVKDLLGLGRVVMEREALEAILEGRESDLSPGLRLSAWRKRKGRSQSSAVGQ